MRPLIIAAAATAVVVFVAVVIVRHRRSEAKASPEVSYVNPKDILFSLPTLCDALPPLLAPMSSPPQGAYRLPDDDWRQVEFVSVADRAVVERELRELHQFKLANSKGQGWKAVYVRKSRPDGLQPARLSFASLEHLLSGYTATSTLLLDSSAGLSPVDGGFVFRLSPTLALYGHQDPSGTIASLSLDLHAEPSETDPYRSELLKTICRTFNVFVVDWYHEGTFGLQ